MSVLSGLDAIRKKIDERPKGFDNVNDRELTRNIESGKKRTIRFVQELDPEAKNYDERYGTGLVVAEWQHPAQNLWWLLLVDTTDEEGECWAAEQEGWKSKLNLYVNVVDVDTGEVFYLQRSVLGGLGADIIESASERGTITDATWTIKKTGEKMNTKYSLTMKDFASDPLEVDPDDLIDFEESVLNQVPSDEQEAFVKTIEQRVAAKAAEKGGSGGGSAASSDDDGDVW